MARDASREGEFVKPSPPWIPEDRVRVSDSNGVRRDCPAAVGPGRTRTALEV